MSLFWAKGKMTAAEMKILENQHTIFAALSLMTTNERLQQYLRDAMDKTERFLKEMEAR